MDVSTDIQSQLKNLTNKTAHIEKMLGRGSKTIVLQLGSHSIKYGIANDPNPQWLRCAVARRLQMIPEATPSPQLEPDLEQLDEVSQKIEEFLIGKGNITAGEGSGNKQKVKTMKTETIKEKVDYVDKPSSFNKSYYVGEEVYYLEGRKDYVVREPIQFGLLNTDIGYSEMDAVNDLELVIWKAIEYMDIPKTEIDQYSVVLCAPDKFHRAQMKLILDMMTQAIGFAGFSIHLESVLASFGSGLQLACVLDIGYTSITVTTIEEGIIVPNSQIKKHFGVRDIDILLWNMVKNKGSTLIPDTSEVSTNKLKHLAALEKFREKYSTLQRTVDLNKIGDMNLPAELNEPTKLSIPVLNDFVIAPALFFHSRCMDLLPKRQALEGKSQFDRSSEFFEGYIDEEDFHDDTEAKVNKMMAQCLQSQDQTKKQQILEQSKIDVTKIQQETSMDNLEDMISYSIFQLKDADSRKKAANSIIITGGFARTPLIVEELEDRLIERIAKFDPNIERVEVVDFSKRDFDNAEMVWYGGSIIPKLDCMKESFVSKNRWLGRIDTEEERERRVKKDCPEFGIKYLKEKITFQW